MLFRSADTEGAVVDNIRRKDQQHRELSAAMMDQMVDFMRREVFGAAIEKTDYSADMDMELPGWMREPWLQ